MKKLGEKILFDRARRYIAKHQPLLIGVTGSAGKTLTKDAIALALAGSRRVCASHSSYNTPLGVALSILGVRSPTSRRHWLRLLVGSRIKEAIEEEPDTIVLELGADRPGDIDFLASKLPFTVGVLTNIGSSHMQYFTSKEMIAHEKMSLPVSLPANGTAVLNADDPLVAQMRHHVQAGVILYGESPAAQVRLTRAVRMGAKGFMTEISVAGRAYEAVFPHLTARHQLWSVLAALAVAKVVLPLMKGELEGVLQNLRRLKPPAGRLRLFDGVRDSTILDDTYNASPESTAAALNVLAAVPAAGRRIAVLGDMLELGPLSSRAHQSAGQQAAQVADIVIFVGPEARHAQAAALQIKGVDTHHFSTAQEAAQWLPAHIRAGDTILVKGSRAMHMETAVKALLENPARDAQELVH